MTGRDDLDELHELAALISADASGWRAHHRQRVLEHRHARLLEDLNAPGKRRRRHRIVAAIVIGVVAIALVVIGALVHRKDHPVLHAAPVPVTSVHGYSLPYVRAGHVAAAGLAAEGRAADAFSCEAWFQTSKLGSVPGQQGAAWHAGFIRACVSSANNAGDTAG